MGWVSNTWIVKATYVKHKASGLLWILRYSVCEFNSAAGPLKALIHHMRGLGPLMHGFHRLSPIRCLLVDINLLYILNVIHHFCYMIM